MKKILIGALFLSILAACISLFFYNRNWTMKYHAELDRFFGKDNWECIDEETKTSLIYTNYYHNHSNPLSSGEKPGRYQNWYIEFANRHGEEEVWYITNHVQKINHDKYSIFSPKRYSGKQALTLELMEISFGMVGDEVYRDVLLDILSEEEASCFEVSMSYDNGNPPPEFYTQLAKEDWFFVNTITANNYLSYDAYTFYLSIRVHDYRLEKLTDEQQENVINSYETILDRLCETYGENASFWLHIDGEHSTEYRNGHEI